MMKSKTVTYPVCGTCDRVLASPNDGIVIHGCVYAAGPQIDGATPLVGSRPGLRNGGSITARCWGCFNKETHNSEVMEANRRAEAEAQRARDIDDRRWQHGDDERGSRQGPTGPMSPPDLPRDMSFPLPKDTRDEIARTKDTDDDG